MHGFTINWGNNNIFQKNNAKNNNLNGYSVYYGEFNQFTNNTSMLNLNYGFFFDNIMQNNYVVNNSACGNNQQSFLNYTDKNILLNNRELNYSVTKTTTTASYQTTGTTSDQS